MAKDTVIDITTTPRHGMRGRLERLFMEHSMKAQALRIAADLLDEDDRRNAAETLPKKLRGAIESRNGHNNPPAKIRGMALSVFLLETTESGADMATILERLTTASGGPIASGKRAITAPLAGLVKYGYLKVKAGNYTRTAKGATRAAAERAKLERKGLIPPGGYLS